MASFCGKYFCLKKPKYLSTLCDITRTLSFKYNSWLKDLIEENSLDIFSSTCSSSRYEYVVIILNIFLSVVTEISALSNWDTVMVDV